LRFSRSLDKTGKTFFAVAPTPKDWSKERKESFFHEYNNYYDSRSDVHEAMPGHFLQLAHANEFRAPTLVRAIFAAAHYRRVGRLLRTNDGGTGLRRTGSEMQQLKMRLRAIANAILDQAFTPEHDREGSDGFDDERNFQQKAKRLRNGNARGSPRRNSRLISWAPLSISICAQRTRRN